MFIKCGEQGGARQYRDIFGYMRSTALKWLVCGVVLSSSTSATAMQASLGRAASALAESVEISDNVRHNVAVFNKDDRTSVPGKYSHLKKQIGLLYNGESEILCTAFCVAPNVIATAAHCLFGSKPQQKPNLTKFSFRLTSDGNTHIDTKLAGSNKGAVSQNVIAGTRGLRTTPPMDAPKDWALAKLQTPACKHGTLTVAPKPSTDLVRAADRKSVFQIAFHWDFEHWKLAYSGPCDIKRFSGKLNWRDVKRLFSQAGSLVLHTCDTGGASSGSPIFHDDGRGPTVVGINVGTYEQRNVLIKSGKIIKRSRAEIIANTGVNASAFSQLMAPLRDANILENIQDVKWLQTALQLLGLYNGTIDGRYGPGTRSAIMSYEQMNNKTPTGLPTQTMLRELTSLIIQHSEIKTSHTNFSNVPLPNRKPKSDGRILSDNLEDGLKADQISTTTATTSELTYEELSEQFVDTIMSLPEYRTDSNHADHN